MGPARACLGLPSVSRSVRGALFSKGGGRTGSAFPRWMSGDDSFNMAATMGRKGGTETISAVLLAFLAERVWKQSELARRVGVERKTLVSVLTSLQQGHVPLEREVEHPHVYWSVPSAWFPGAVAFQGDEIADLIRLLQRSPKSKRRDRLVHAIAESATGLRLAVDSGAVVTRPLRPEDEEHLLVLEDSADKHVTVHAHYYTLWRNVLGWRDISVQRVYVDRGRFLGVCHRSDKLKWFRLDGVLSVRMDATQPFRTASAEAVQKKEEESLDGFHSGDPPTRCVFRVRLPEARWFRKQLDAPFEVEENEDELVFTVTTSGVIALARAVVGLGGAASVQTEELGKLVAELAEGALPKL